MSLYLAHTTGRFVVSGTSLRYDGPPASWEVTREEVLCAGEATHDSGRSGEDWLLCLVTDRGGQWVEASLYSEGRNEALQWLSVQLRRSVEVKLVKGPPFRSRVMWPTELAERPLFIYQMSLLRRLFTRPLRWLGIPPPDGVQAVHPAVLEHLRGERVAEARNG